MNKEQIKELEELLDVRFQIAIDTDKRMGNEDIKFLPSNPDYCHYNGMLEIIEALGLDWRKKNGKHKLFK